MPNVHSRPRRFNIVITVVCTAAALTGAFFGGIALMLYVPWERGAEPSAVEWAGPIAGGIGAVVAGWVWCKVMLTHAQQLKDVSFAVGRAAGLGAMYGGGVGALDAIWLHSVLHVVFMQFQPIAFVLGVGFGLAAGAIVGLVCGALWQLLIVPEDA